MTVPQFFAALCKQMIIGRMSRKKNLVVDDDQPPHKRMIFFDFQKCVGTIMNKRQKENRSAEPIRPAEILYILNRVEWLLNERMREAVAEKDNHELNRGQMHLEQAEFALTIWRPNLVYFCEVNNLIYRRKAPLDLNLP